MGTAAEELASRVLARAAARGATVAVAESLTGGMVADALVTMPGASAVLRLGVVAYATPLKASVLRVPQALLDARGAVDPEVSAAMARGVRMLAATEGEVCTIGVATTGVAGPRGQDGHPPGEVHVAAAARTREGEALLLRELAVPGEREAVRAAATLAALELLDAMLDRTDLDTGHPDTGRPGAGGSDTHSASTA